LPDIFYSSIGTTALLEYGRNDHRDDAAPFYERSIKWDASSRWSFHPNPAWGSIEMMTIGKTHPTLIHGKLATTLSQGSCQFSTYEVLVYLRYDKTKLSMDP